MCGGAVGCKETYGKNMMSIGKGRRPRRKAAPGDVNNPDNFLGQRVRKKFGNDFYLGDITGYDDPYFQILYEDGDDGLQNKRVLHRQSLRNKGPSPFSAACPVLPFRLNSLSNCFFSRFEIRGLFVELSPESQLIRSGLNPFRINPK